jgi:acyl carrier protein
MNTTKEQVATDLKKVLAEELFVEVPVEQMKDTDSLSNDLGLDSVGHIELVSILEERYGFKVDAQKAVADMRTIGSTAEFVCKQIQNGESSGPAEQKEAAAA